MLELDNSMRRDFDSCPKLYDWRYNFRLVPTEPKSMAPFFGIAVHKGNAVWYKDDSKDDEAALRAFGEEYAKYYDGRDEDRTAENGFFVLKEYFNQFREDYLKTVAVEIGFAIELGEIIYHGRIDRWATWEGEPVIEDWKTTKYPGSGFVLSEPNNQFTGYVLAAREITGEKVKSIFVTQIGTQIKNVERKSKTNPEPKKRVEILRDVTMREERHFEEFKRGLELSIESIKWCIAHSYWPKQTSNCSSFQGCEYLPLCRATEEAIPYLVNTMYKEKKIRPWEEEEGGER